MQSKKDAIEKLKPFYGKTVTLEDGAEFYIFRPQDMESGGLIDEILENFEGSENENDEPLDFDDYIVFACDGVELEDGEAEVEQLSDFIALNRTSGEVILISEGSYISSFDSIDDFIVSITDTE